MFKDKGRCQVAKSKIGNIPYCSTDENPTCSCMGKSPPSNKFPDMWTIFLLLSPEAEGEEDNISRRK
jgi:hypothetical protein